MVPVAHANDGGGSIRIPASCCGLVGLKPSRGRVSLAPEFAEFAGAVAIEGCVSRNVADTALILDVISGYEPGDPYWAPPPSRPFAEAVERPPGTLRIAFTAVAPNGAPVDDECVAAVTQAAELLESLGHSVEEAPAFVDEGYVENFIKIWTAGVADEVHTYGRLRGAPLDLEKLEPLTRADARHRRALQRDGLPGRARLPAAHGPPDRRFLERHRRAAHSHGQPAAATDRRAGAEGGRASDPTAA